MSVTDMMAISFPVTSITNMHSYASIFSHCCLNVCFTWLLVYVCFGRCVCVCYLHDKSLVVAASALWDELVLEASALLIQLHHWVLATRRQNGALSSHLHVYTNTHTRVHTYMRAHTQTHTHNHPQNHKNTDISMINRHKQCESSLAEAHWHSCSSKPWTTDYTSDALVSTICICIMLCKHICLCCWNVCVSVSV